MEDFEKQEKLNSLAHDVLILSRNTLLVNLRFLDAALSRFEYYPCDESTLLTDGKYLIYNPKHILKCYKQQKENVVRDYLHIVLHCVFSHMFMNPNLNRPYWDLACDIAVESAITDLGLKSATAGRENRQRRYIDELKKDMKLITAEKIYHYLVECKADEKKVAEMRGEFYADNHEIWYMTEEEKQAVFGIGMTTSSGDSGNGESEVADEDDNIVSLKAVLMADWKEVAQRMQVEMEPFGKQQGNHAGSMMQNLESVNREKYDYTAFLKKFAVMGEAMKINDDEFDYIFYTYGLQLYDKMPLIEPLEYKDVKRIKEFVIAIDTSGSTSGELVQKFVQKTYNILKSTESFFSKINLHIIQCDAEIQEDVKITNQDEFDEYLKNMKIKGLGGTDFRPVFEYVEKLRADKEFVNLKGLIYFTDGYGTFPNKKPDYDTAFVYIDDEYNNPDVPPWAIKLVLQKDEI